MAQNRPTVIDINCTTNQETVREMTDEEYAQHLIDVEIGKEMETKRLAAEAAKETVE